MNRHEKSIAFLIMILVLFSEFCVPDTAFAEGKNDTFPVNKEDLKAFLLLAKQEKCRNETPPFFKVDPLLIVKDQSGRTYGDTNFKLHMDWCNYSVEAAGKVDYHDFQNPTPPPSFFQPRLKILAGFAGFNLWNKGLKEGALVSLSAQAIVVKDFYPFLHVGNLGFGGGVGYYLTPTLGLDLAYLYGWDGSSQPVLGVSLGLWLQEACKKVPRGCLPTDGVQLGESNGRRSSCRGCMCPGSHAQIRCRGTGWVLELHPFHHRSHLSLEADR